MRSPWRWLADWALDGVDWSHVGRQNWVMRGGEELQGVRVIAGSFQVSRQLLGPWGGSARMWPSLDEIMMNQLSAAYRSHMEAQADKPWFLR